MDIKRSAIIGTAICFSLCAVVTWAADMVPGAGVALWAAKVLPLSAPHAVAADRALNAKDFPAAVANTKAALSLSPVDGSAWLQLAKIDVASHRGLTRDGAGALNHAYDAFPYDLNPNSDRMAFMLAHLTELPPDLKLSLSDELGLWGSSPSLRARLATIAASTRDNNEYQTVKTILAKSVVN